MGEKKEAPTVTDQLREAIRNSGRSLNQLGNSAGLSSSQLSRFMTGKRGLTTDAVDRLCQALGLHLAANPAGPARAATSGERAAKKSKGRK